MQSAGAWAARSCGMMRVTLMSTTLAFASPWLALSGYVLDDSSIHTAVRAWVSDATAAEAKYGHISKWETGGVTDMSLLFYRKSSFNEDIGAWDTSGVTRMDYMFEGASYFNEDISAWDASGVTNMDSMFISAASFNQDISGWAVDSVTDMSWMFHGTSAFD